VKVITTLHAWKRKVNARANGLLLGRDLHELLRGMFVNKVKLGYMVYFFKPDAGEGKYYKFPVKWANYKDNFDEYVKDKYK